MRERERVREREREAEREVGVGVLPVSSSHHDLDRSVENTQTHTYACIHCSFTSLCIRMLDLERR